MPSPFAAGQRVQVHWAGDDSVLIGNLSNHVFEHPEDLVIHWGNQLVHFWDGAGQGMTYIFGLNDVTIEILEPAP